MIPKFRTAEVAALHEEICEYGHAENPFLDAKYSLGGYYPVTDFTDSVAGWIQQGRSAAIAELWGSITANGIAEAAMLRMAMAANAIPELGLDEATMAEAKAVHVLGSRMSLYEFGQKGTPYVIGRVLATRLASIAWKPPRETLVHLRKGAENQALFMPEFHPPDYKRTVAERAMAALLSPRNEEDRNVGEWMLRIPPMARSVIADYFQRGDGRLRFVLGYSDRKYGCSGPINQRWVTWVGCFKPPGDDAVVPHALTKEHISAAFRSAGVPFKKSISKAAMVEEVRRHPGMLREIFTRELPEYGTPKPGWKNALESWSSRCAALHPIALAILHSLALQSSRVRL